LPEIGLLGARARDVDDRRFAGDRHCFLHAADAEIAVDRGDEATGQLDPIALDRGEPRQRERDRIGAGSQILIEY
jgi:hypothetical protein